MFFPVFGIFVPDRPFGVVPVYTGKGSYAWQGVLHCLGISIRTGRPVICQMASFIKLAFHAVNIIRADRHAIITFFKMGVGADKDKYGYPDGQTDDVDESVSPMTGKIAPGNQ